MPAADQDRITGSGNPGDTRSGKSGTVDNRDTLNTGPGPDLPLSRCLSATDAALITGRS